MQPSHDVAELNITLHCAMAWVFVGKNDTLSVGHNNEDFRVMW
jgi:hypothetical protein